MDVIYNVMYEVLKSIEVTQEREPCCGILLALATNQCFLFVLKTTNDDL